MFGIRVSRKRDRQIEREREREREKRASERRADKNVHIQLVTSGGGFRAPRNGCHSSFPPPAIRPCLRSRRTKPSNVAPVRPTSSALTHRKRICS